MDKPRVKVPKTVEKGKPFEVKALISHKMESGQRTDEATGERIPRMIINRFVCKLDGTEVFSMTMHPAVSANPYVSFYVTADKSGELEFIWTDDENNVASAKKKIEVKG